MASGTKVDIWNQALDKIGETDPIEDELEDRVAAAVCRRHYPRVLRQLLEGFTWPFAVRQVVITQPDGVTRYGWGYVYTLPDDFLSVIAFVSDTVRWERAIFEVQANDTKDGLILLTNLDPTSFSALEYTALVEYTPIYPGAFEDAVAWSLAVELARALKKDEATAARCRQEAMNALSWARATVMNNTKKEADPTTPSIAARYGFSSDEW